MARKTWIILGVVVALAVGGGAWYFLGASGDSAIAATQAGTNDPITDHDMTMGNPKAKVVFIEYAAPMCPHCAHFNNEILPAIKKDYIDTGKVFYVFRIFPIGAPDGVAEKLARCLPKAKYFPFMDQLFHSQQQWDPEYGVQDVRGALLQQARTAGMSEEQFNTCNADTKEEAIINQVASDGQARYSITGTPTIVVNGVNVSPGRVPTLEQMRGFLDAALAGKS
ncbi:MAG TPA: thioredoxin domain-containing protein [Rhizomicrobium sp.]|jgi:protein-disulfide isomerase|nr:thioredoxin domain-containing protein [Rhizomicrobium sp.]